MEVAGARGALALLGAHLVGVDAAFPKELAVGHSEGLADGLSDELGLQANGQHLSGGCPTHLLQVPQTLRRPQSQALPPPRGTGFPGDSAMPCGFRDCGNQPLSWGIYGGRGEGRETGPEGGGSGVGRQSPRLMGRTRGFGGGKGDSGPRR